MVIWRNKGLQKFCCFRFFSVEAKSPIPSKIKSLQKFGVSREKLNLFAYISELPYTDKLFPESKVLDELFSQAIDVHTIINEEKEDSQDRGFYMAELDTINQAIEDEYSRILGAVVESHFSTEIDRIEGARLEFRAGVGGAEGLLFADEMAQHYGIYLMQKGYKIESISSVSHGGKVVAFKAKGNGVYKMIVHESGVHKVIRVPETESRGRLHSSTISIVVLPDVPFEFRLNEKELKFEYMRAQGPGGQHVNKTESACRITHIPTGITVLIQDDRSQANNRATALEIIREKLYQLEFTKKMNEESAKRKSQIGSGDRSDKIRTYNFPQDRVTDHRIGKTFFGIKNLLESGELFDECIQTMEEITKEQNIKDFNEMIIKKYNF